MNPRKRDYPQRPLSALQRMYSTAGTMDTAQSTSVKSPHIAGICIASWLSCLAKPARHTFTRQRANGGPFPSIRALLLIEQSFKAGKFAQKRKLYSAGGTIALLCNDQFGKAGIFVRRFVNFFAVDEHDQIRILLDRAGFTQIRELRFVVALALFGSAA